MRIPLPMGVSLEVAALSWFIDQSHTVMGEGKAGHKIVFTRHIPIWPLYAQ